MCVLYMFVCKQHVIVVLLCVCIWLAHESASRRAFRQPQHSVFETLNCPVLSHRGAIICLVVAV